MHILFLHPNYPGQFVRLANALAQEGYLVHGSGDATQVQKDFAWNYPVLVYPCQVETRTKVHPVSQRFDVAVRRGLEVAKFFLRYKQQQGFEPDLIFVHPGWGDGMFLKDIFPGASVIGLFEYYYRWRGTDVGFDPEFPPSFEDVFRVRTLNAVHLLALDAYEAGYCPTEFQRSCFPKVYQGWLHLIHDGIDTQLVAPDPKAKVKLPDGSEHRAGEEILTFVSRNLEPYRGYHIFMRALPEILRRRPKCQVIIVGDDKTSYGKAPPPGQTWRQKYWAQVASKLDSSRVHFAGFLPYDAYLKVLQVSRVHVYLTYPFVLSWSVLEAMAAGCLVVGSDTEPVREVIQHGVNGLLVPFFDVQALAETVVQALEAPAQYAELRQLARKTIVERYDFATVSYPAFKRLIENFS